MLDILNLPTLVLDRIHRPIEISNARESVCDILNGKASSILDREYVIHSQRFSMKVPNIIVSYNGIYKTIARWSKLNTLYRDDQQCCYCGKRFLDIKKLNIDHIVPKCKFNNFLKDKSLQAKFIKFVVVEIPKQKNSWLNTICTCKKCNEKKKNKFIWESGFKLIKKPFIPKYTPKIILSIEYAERNSWIPYLEKFNGINVRLN